MPPVLAQTESAPVPSASATEERGAGAGQRQRVDPRQVDPRRVADRVYDLMTRELRLARERGEMGYRE